MNEDNKNFSWEEKPEENNYEHKTEEVLGSSSEQEAAHLPETDAERNQQPEPAESISTDKQPADEQPNDQQSEQERNQQTANQSQWQNNGGTGGYYQASPYSPTAPQYQSPYQQPYGQSRQPQTPPPVSPFQNQQPRQEYQWSVFGYQQPQQEQKPKKNKGLLVFSIILAVALFFTAGAFVIYAATNYNPHTQTGDAQNGPTASGPSLSINSRPADNAERTEDGKLTDTAIAKKVKPSVVGIVAYVKTQTQYQVYGQGSGIIMSKDGYIITNAHVITVERTGNLVDKVQVYLDNNDSYAGEIVGADSRSDLAVIKIRANNLTPAEFGDSTTVEVGEHVLAVGNPSGMELAGSVTGGMVSAVNRNIRSGSNGFSMVCIQTDAAINPGNSGGALVNTYGQVIGINSSKIVADEYEGIGFAIAINEAKPIVDSITKNGYVEGRVKVGITYQEIDDFTAALNRVPKGLRVSGIDSTLSGVAQSGLQVGDIITKMDGKEITTTEQVTEFLKGKKPGDTVKMTVYRITDIDKSQTLTVTVVLSEDRGQTVSGTTK